MKKFILLLLFYATSQAQVSLTSWNLKDFGNSKSPENLEFIANTLQHSDIVALQEVVAGNGGAQTVAKLAALLNLKGTKWDYVVSNPTSGSSYKTERYAFLWKTSRVKKMGDAWLEAKYALEIDREPFFASFKYQEKTFTVVNFHAITKSKQPETEIKYFKLLPAQYPDKNLIFLGDFNCPQSHTVFNPLKKMGYLPAFTNQKTSLKKECREDICLASEFDNIFFNSTKIKVLDAKANLFYSSFPNLAEARTVSDHIPITMTFSLVR